MRYLSAILATLMAFLTAPQEVSGGVTIEEKHRQFFASYCVECHNAEKTKGKVRLDAEALAFQIDSIPSADLWQKILDALNAQEMPPEGDPQPTEEDKAEFLGMLSGKLVEARALLTDSGGQIIMRRLNQREYQNTLEDLLGVPVNVDNLPSDETSGSFDTNGGALFLSPDQIEQYLQVARTAVANSLIPPNPYGHIKRRFEAEEITAPPIHKEHKKLATREQAAKDFEADTSDNPDPKKYGLLDVRDVRIAHDFYNRFYGAYDTYLKNPLSESGTLLSYWKPVSELSIRLVKLRVKVPLPTKKDGLPRFNEIWRPYPNGLYTVKARVGLTPQAIESGDPAFIEFGVRRAEGGYIKVQNFEVTKSAEEGQIIETQLYVNADNKHLVFTEEADEGRARFRYTKRHRATNQGGGHNGWVDWVEIAGPAEDAKPEAVQNIFSSLTKDSTKEEVLVLLKAFGEDAYRGQSPTPDLLAAVYEIYLGEIASNKKPLEAIVEPMAVLLSTPSFLYLNEPTGNKEEKPLNQRELAVRLAYLLTSAAPDDELLKWADKGLLKEGKLQQQVDRLLASPEANRFYESFLYQWLHMERLSFFQFKASMYPTFSHTVKDAAAEEVYQTFKTIVDEDLDTINLLQSDFVVINALMAEHYGIRGVQGDHYRKVALPNDSVRGGLTGMAAILAMGSDGIHTSPVERGAWVLRKILNDPPPPAPANVPMLSRLKDEKLTKEQLLKAHKEEAQCAHCHKKIDPIGLGLENFDATGQWRSKKTLDKFTYPIDPSGQIHRGPKFQNYQELNDYFASKVDDFNRGLIENLLSYSLGRQIGFTDKELVDSLHQEMKQKGNKLRPVIHSIIESEAFQSKK